MRKRGLGKLVREEEGAEDGRMGLAWPAPGGPPQPLGALCLLFPLHGVLPQPCSAGLPHEICVLGVGVGAGALGTQETICVFRHMCHSELLLGC